MISKVYPYSSEIAQQIGEKSQYSVSRVENIKCAMDIKDAIDACKRPGNNGYDMIAAVKSIINKHGTERTNWVLANSILVNTDDERISKSNKEWAKAFPIPQESSNWDYSIQTHPSLINSFAIGMREVCSEIHNAQKQEKPSILGQVKDNAAAISTAEKKETPNKQNGLEV